MARKRNTRKKPVGGIAFFGSYFIFTILTASNFVVLSLVWHYIRFYDLTLLGTGLVLGWWAGFTLFRGQISVLIHEYKHAILALLVGNEWKKLRLKGMSGVFHYTYTKDTEEYNAFISLAPYFLPVFSIFGVFCYFLIEPQSFEGAMIVLGAFHGAELYFNLKDATPIQTDLTGIRGGYLVALGYIAAVNFVITSTLVIGALTGEQGLEVLTDTFWVLGAYLVAVVRAIFIPS